MQFYLCSIWVIVVEGLNEVGWVEWLPFHSVLDEVSCILKVWGHPYYVGSALGTVWFTLSTTVRYTLDSVGSSDFRFLCRWEAFRRVYGVRSRSHSRRDTTWQEICEIGLVRWQQVSSCCRIISGGPLWSFHSGRQFSFVLGAVFWGWYRRILR